MEEAWTTLGQDEGDLLWERFADRFDFRPGMRSTTWPAIREPVPSVTYSLAPVFEGDFAAGALAVARLILRVLRATTPPDQEVIFHDWVHPSARVDPARIDDVTDADDYFPNGDYKVFLWDRQRLGVFGHPWERSLCGFGTEVVAAFKGLNQGELPTILRERRDGHR